MKRCSGETFEKICGPHWRGAKSGILLAYVDTLFLIAVFSSSTLFQKYETSDILSIMCFFGFIICTILLWSKLIFKNLINIPLIWGAIFTIVVVFHQELNMYILEYAGVSPPMNSLNIFYINNHFMLIGIVYPLIFLYYFPQAPKYLALILIGYISFRRPYPSSYSNAILSQAIQVFLSLSLCYIALVYKDKRSMITQDMTLNQKIEIVSYQTTERVNINKDSVPPISASSAKKLDIIIEPNVMNQGPPSTNAERSKVGGDTTRGEDGIAGDEKKSIDFHYDYSLGYSASSDEIKTLAKIATDKNLNSMYDQIKTSLSTDKPIEIFQDEDEEEDKQPNEASSFEEQEGIGVIQKKDLFEFMSYDKNTKKVVLRSRHLTLNQLVNCLKEEYSKTDALPFAKFLNQTAAIVQKSKSAGGMGIYSDRILRRTSLKQQSFHNDLINDLASTNLANRKKSRGLETSLMVAPNSYNIEILAKIKADGIAAEPAPRQITKSILTTQPCQEVSYVIDTVVVPQKISNQYGRAASDKEKVEIPSDYNITVYFKKAFVHNEAEKHKTNEMLNLIAHEMRSPLVAIDGLIKLFISRSSQVIVEPHQTQYNNLVDNYLFKASFHIRNLLDACQLILELAKSHNHKFEIKSTEFDLKKLIAETCKMFEKVLEEKTKEVKIQHYCDEKINQFIKSDPTRLRQILINLLSNSIKYTLKGTITVSAFYETFYRIRISVKDTGLGIKEEDLDKLFREFGRVQNKEDKLLNEKGVGLGLVLSNQLAYSLSSPKERKGIKVASKYGEWSEFTFWIENKFKSEVKSVFFSTNVLNQMGGTRTLTKMTSGAASKDSCEQQVKDHMLQRYKTVSMAKDKTVLIVDDSELNLEIVSELFKNLGFSCILATNPLIGLEKIQERLNSTVCPICRLFDMIVTDMEMPFMSGIEFAQKVRGIVEYKDTPLICSSANDLDPKMSKIFSGSLLKPISSKDIEILTSTYFKGKNHVCEVNSKTQNPGITNHLSITPPSTGVAARTGASPGKRVGFKQQTDDYSEENLPNDTTPHSPIEVEKYQTDGENRRPFSSFVNNMIDHKS